MATSVWRCVPGMATGVWRHAAGMTTSLWQHSADVRRTYVGGLAVCVASDGRRPVAPTVKWRSEPVIVDERGGGRSRLGARSSWSPLAPCTLPLVEVPPRPPSRPLCPSPLLFLCVYSVASGGVRTCGEGLGEGDPSVRDGASQRKRTLTGSFLPTVLSDGSGRGSHLPPQPSAPPPTPSVPPPNLSCGRPRCRWPPSHLQPTLPVARGIPTPHTYHRRRGGATPAHIPSAGRPTSPACVLDTPRARRGG